MNQIEFLQKNKFTRKIIYKLGRSRAKKMVKNIEKYFNKTDKILDIGSGICNICEILKEENFNVTPLDIKNLSFVDNIEPIIYNGDKIPFDDNEFDVALISTVLHHCRKPEEIIKEAKRVSKRIVIIEDIYLNEIHKHLTYFFDSLINLEFTGHPHTNKTNEGWQALFKKLNLKLKDVKYANSYLVFKQAMYYLEK